MRMQERTVKQLQFAAIVAFTLLQWGKKMQFIVGYIHHSSFSAFIYRHSVLSNWCFPSLSYANRSQDSMHY